MEDPLPCYYFGLLKRHALSSVNSTILKANYALTFNKLKTTFNQF